MYDEALGVKDPQPKLMDVYPQFEELLINYKILYNWNQKKIVSPKKHKNNHGLWRKYFVVK